MTDGRLLKLDDGKPNPREEKILRFLKSKIKGQDRALQYFAKAYARACSSFRDPTKPLFVGLLLGPSGVGKTFLAETLAQFLFGDTDSLTKINCAEFSEKHEIAKLIGAPPGYIGYINSEEDPGGSQYILGQRSIDKFHYERNARVHKKELDSLDEREVELTVKNFELQNLYEELKKLLAKNKVYESPIASLEKEIADMQDGPDRQEKEKTLKEYQEAAGRYWREWNAWKEESEKLKKDFQEAAKKGWIYDPRRYPLAKGLISIILFDEVEKADDALFNALLEIMDKGRLQLGNGLTTSFKNSFIFLTGNVGSKQIADLLNDVTGKAERLGFRRGAKREVADLDEEIYRIAMEEARAVFRPEFLGRIDKKIVFRPIPKETMAEILETILEKLKQELATSDLFLIIKVDQRVKEYILKKAMKYPEEGARLLKSRVNDYIKDPLISLIATEQLAPNDIVAVKLEKKDEKEKISFYKELPS